MLSTVNWPNDMSSEFQAERYSPDAMTTSSESPYIASTSLVQHKAAVAFFGFLEILTNGFVLAGF